MDQAIYAKYIFAKHLETATIKENSNYHKTIILHDMIFTKQDNSATDEQVEIFSRYYNIHYRACV